MGSQGCAVTKGQVPPVATMEGVVGRFERGQILDLRQGKAVSFEELIDDIASVDLVFVGEAHDNPEHHLIQTQLLQALWARRGRLAVAIEYLPGSTQGAVDRYLRGESTEQEFLAESDWKGTWGYDYHLYRPLILAAKQGGGRVIALNAPREVVRKVARYGLEGLSEGERAELPPDIDLSDKAHRDYLREVYQQHAHGSLKHFEYFYEAQCVWEDTMAHHLAAYLVENPGPVVAFTGNGHIVNKFGIPNRTAKRFPVSMVTIMPYPLNEDIDIKGETADYIWLTSDCSRRRGRVK
jgi:uncharacterized iron-regulated protein